MKKPNWKSLYFRIPGKLKIRDKEFKVQWTDQFPNDKKQLGESDWNNKVMTIKRGQSKKEAVHTYFHELCHLFSDEFDIKLSEKQVQKLEKTLKYWLICGNIFL